MTRAGSSSEFQFLVAEADPADLAQQLADPERERRREQDVHQQDQKQRIRWGCCCALSEVFTLPSSSRLSPFPVSASVTAITTSTKIPRDANRIIFVFVALSIVLLFFRFLFYPDNLLYKLYPNDKK